MQPSPLSGCQLQNLYAAVLLYIDQPTSRSTPPGDVPQVKAMQSALLSMRALPRRAESPEPVLQVRYAWERNDGPGTIPESSTPLFEVEYSADLDTLRWTQSAQFDEWVRSELTHAARFAADEAAVTHPVLVCADDAPIDAVRAPAAAASTLTATQIVAQLAATSAALMAFAAPVVPQGIPDGSPAIASPAVSDASSPASLDTPPLDTASTCSGDTTESEISEAACPSSPDEVMLGAAEVAHLQSMRRQPRAEFVYRMKNGRRQRVKCMRDGRQCSNCATRTAPTWRRGREDQRLYCNACKIYLDAHGYDRPFASMMTRPDKDCLN